MKALIVSTTHVGAKVCVGALAENDTSLRLLDSLGDFLPPSLGFQVGQIYDLRYGPTVHALRPPHIENVSLTHASLAGTQQNMAPHLLSRVRPWSGPIHSLFEGKLSFTASDHGYIDDSNIPSTSTGFWLPDQDLAGQTDDNGKTYYFYNQYSISYVGLAPPLSRIPKGTLVRVSLARWWRPRNAAPDFPERCYLQLSGWYL